MKKIIGMKSKLGYKKLIDIIFLNSYLNKYFGKCGRDSNIIVLNVCFIKTPAYACLLCLYTFAKA